MTGVNDLMATAHDFVSMKVLDPLYRLQQLARPSRRPSMLAFQEGMRFRATAASWSEDQKREWILRRLRYCIRRAWADTPYYRQLFARIGFDPRLDFGFNEFARLPVLERDHVHHADNTLLSASIPRAHLKHDATGGSTGQPTEVWLGPEERGWRESGSEYYMIRIGIPRGSRLGLLWGHHLDPVARDGFKDRLHDFMANTRWFDCLRLSPALLAQYHMDLQRWQPHCLVAYAGALGALAEEARDRRWRPHYPTRCFVTGAEKLLPQHRATIESVFARPVHERYGSRDVGLIGFQVAVERTLDFEVDWANVLVEPEGVGVDSAILVTKLHADGMPMIRYRIGDIGRFSRGSTPGHPAFILHGILGREVDRIWLHDGRWINGLQIPHLMKDYPVREFQLVQHADFSVEVRVVSRDGFTDDNARAIVSTLEANLPTIVVTLRVVEALSRTKSGKLRPVISELDRDRLETTR